MCFFFQSVCNLPEFFFSQRLRCQKISLWRSLASGHVYQNTVCFGSQTPQLSQTELNCAKTDTPYLYEVKCIVITRCNGGKLAFFFLFPFWENRLTVFLTGLWCDNHCFAVSKQQQSEGSTKQCLLCSTLCLCHYSACLIRWATWRLKKPHIVGLFIHYSSFSVRWARLRIKNFISTTLPIL